MKIFTSYFDRIIKDGAEGLVPVGIAGISPLEFTGLEYKKLAPKRFIYDNYIKSGNAKQYCEDFYEHVLNKLNSERVIRDLEDLSEGKDIVLLCYEKPNEFCHRHLVADWLNSELGIEVKEL